MSGGLTTFIIKRVEVSFDAGANFIEIPGVQSVSKSGGDGTTNEVRAVSGVSQTASPPTPASYNITLSSLIPNHPSISRMEEAASANQLVQMRFQTDEEIIRPAGTSAAVDGVTILTTGVATLAGTGTQADLTDQLYNEGLVLRTTDGASNPTLVNYTIEEIRTASTAVVYPKPGAAVSTALAYFIVRPAITETISCRITNVGTWDAAEGTPLTGAIVVAAENRALFSI